MEKYVVKNMVRPNEQWLKQLSTYDVSTVFEAQGQVGLLDRHIRPIDEGHLICGPAVTCICGPNDNLMVQQAIEICQPGDVLVITTMDGGDTALIGDVLSHFMVHRGVQGVIVDAAVRDVAQIKKLQLPVWTRAIHSFGPTKHKGGWVNKETVCGGQHISPGDVIMADDDGIVVVKKESLSETVEKTKQRAEKESKIKEEISKGALMMDLLQLRETIEEAGVKMYDSEHDRKK